MDSGDMDMGGDQCSMNVRGAIYQPLPVPRLTCVDAFHMVSEESMYHIPTVACSGHPITSLVPPSDRTHDRGLRIRQRDEQKIRAESH